MAHAETNCLLSEFNNGNIGNFFRSPSWHYKLAGSLFVIELVVLYLGNLAGSNALNIQITPIVAGANGTIKLSNLHLLHGYLVETNHGFFYLTLAPLFVMVGGWFVQSAHDALCLLQRQNRIQTRARKLDIINHVSKENRKWCRWALFILPCLFLGKELAVEIPSYLGVRDGFRHDLGYVQAPFIGLWKDWFEKMENDSLRFQALKSMAQTDLDAKIRLYLQSAPLSTLAKWLKAGALKLTTYPQQGEELQEVLLAEIQKGAFMVDLKLAAETNLLHFRIDGVRGPTSRQSK